MTVPSYDNILLYLRRLKELEHTPSPPLLILYKILGAFSPLQKGGETENVV
jgi:hypothetical protein